MLARRLAYSHRALAHTRACLQAHAFLFASRYSSRARMYGFLGITTIREGQETIIAERSGNVVIRYDT